MNKKVLIIEDDIFLMKVMQKKFEKNGHNTRVLSDGVQALTVTKEFKPDVILVDLIMPIKDGFSAINDLKADPETQNIPIVVTSNLSSDEDIKRTIKLGAMKYFIKSNSDLSEVIEYISSL